MKHELSTYPSALFEAGHIFREADKPQLATAISEHASSVTSGEYNVVKESVPKTTTSLMGEGGLCYTESRGKLHPVMGPLQSHMQTSSFGSMAWQQWYLMDMVVRLSKTTPTNDAE